MVTTTSELSLLRVSGTDSGRQIVNGQGRAVRLRGVCIGGWMNMENFINGYPGVEHSLRAAMAEALGHTKAEFFFDRLLDHFLAEEDIRFIRQLGATCVRIAVNYRHFEDDERPFSYLEKGFERLDRALGWCAKHDLYAILDLHAVQGWQNPDWHSDNRHKHVLLWHHPHFQDRLVALWEELARRYAGNPAVAGYDIMNEPETRDLFGPPNWPAINRIYRRVVEAIRRIDPDHIIFLEGDGFSSRFDGLDPPFAENLVYSSHDYSVAGFGPGPYPGMINGKYRDRAQALESVSNLHGMRYAREHDVPLWIGEFGAVYNGSRAELPDRVRALGDQIDAFERCGAHWTIWTYKDVGIMGVVALDPRSDYLRLVAPILKTKLKLASDAWMRWLPGRAVHRRVRSLSGLLIKAIGDPFLTENNLTHLISDTILAGSVATLLQPAYAAKFKGMSEGEIDEVLMSFALRNCRPNGALIETLKRYMGDEPSAVSHQPSAVSHRPSVIGESPEGAIR